MSQNIDLKNSLDTSLTNEVPETNTKTKKAPEKSIEDIVVQAFMACEKIKTQEANKKQAAQEMRTIDKSGMASKVFVAQMGELLNKGEFKTITYYPALAKKFGDPFEINISGYTLFFKAGYATRVPLPLYDQVMDIFNDGKERFTNQYKLKAFDADNNFSQKDTDLINEYVNNQLRRI